MKDEVQAILEKPFAAEDITKDYNNFDMVKPHLVIRRLNKAFGQDGWQFIPEERIIEHDTIVQFGKIGIKDESGEWIWKHNCGARKCSYIKNTEKRLDVGNDYKSAVSNCLKRCAMLLGVALDLYGAAEHDEDTPPSEKPKSGAQEQRMPSTGNKASTYDGKLHTAVKELEKDIMVATGMSQNELRTKLKGSTSLNTSDAEAMKVYKGLLENEKGDSDE